jgi:large subunit ribosomal protein L10
MKREDKSLAIAELTDRLKQAEAVFAVDYRGISVTQAADLRHRLTEADAVFKVVKNRLAKIAAAESGTEGIDDLLVGPTALTFIHGDAVLAAKAIATFSRENEVLEYKGGLMDGQPLDPDSFQAIARLPGLDVLRGQLTGLAASPITGLVRGLGSMVSGLAIALGQIAERGLVTGEAPAAEEPAPDQPVAEPESEVPAEAEAAAEDAPAEEAPAEQAEEPAEEQPEAEAEVSTEEDQPEEPAADAEAEGSKE